LQFYKIEFDFYVLVVLHDNTVGRLIRIEKLQSRASWRWTAWHDWLDAGYVLTWGDILMPKIRIR